MDQLSTSPSTPSTNVPARAWAFGWSASPPPVAGGGGGPPGWSPPLPLAAAAAASAAAAAESAAPAPPAPPRPRRVVAGPASVVRDGRLAAAAVYSE